MPNPSKSRPVDALFGDDSAPALPNYIVEPAQPVTTVAPPPLDAAPPPSTAPFDSAQGRAQGAPDIPAATPAPAPPIFGPDMPTPEPIIAPRGFRSDEDRFAPLAERIERLYG
ncbi:MAG: hypothetical protein AB1817_16645, partial [Chloroflexota bacterium]